MTEQMKALQPLKGKILLTGILKIVTGLHIGGSSDFAPIGAVDSPFIRDPLTHAPIIPGSSLKGKLRTLLAKKNCQGYILNKIEDDNEVITRLFGAGGKQVSLSRLQFYDLFVTEDTIKNFAELNMDTYLGEIKFENTISRTTGVANPRQIERVPAGAEFTFKLVYNIEKPEEVDADLKALAEGLKLLEYDYLGGHGSRGYGRVKFEQLALKPIGTEIDLSQYNELFN